MNYTWHARAPAQAAAAAGARARQVYMGIDVFGRGTWGGGGFRTHVALAAAFDAGFPPSPASLSPSAFKASFHLPECSAAELSGSATVTTLHEGASTDIWCRTWQGAPSVSWICCTSWTRWICMAVWFLHLHCRAAAGGQGQNPKRLIGVLLRYWAAPA